MTTHRVLPAVVLILLVACSSGDDPVTPANQPPTVAFTFAKIGVPRGTQVNLTVDAADPNEDELTINWTITRGTLAPQNSEKSIMRWTPPATVGVDTVTIRVSDGTFSRSVTAVVKVGWLTSVAPPVFQKARSPYIVALDPSDPTLSVVANEQSIIEAGTEILIDTPEAIISVLGTLEARGTALEPIVIHPNDRTFVCGDERGWWEGIRAATDDALFSDGFVDLEHAEVWYAQSGVRLRDNSAAVIRDCKFRCSGSSGVLIEGNGSLRVFDTEINNGLGDGIALAAFSSLPDSVRIEGCRIAINGNAGIRMDLYDGADVVPVVVEFNNIEFNAVHGISLAHAVFPEIHYNRFSGNGESSVSNIYLQDAYPFGAPVDTLYATCNFWGAAVGNQSTIDTSIRDSLDTPNVDTRVKTCPWLNVNPLTTTPKPNCSMSCP